MASLRSLLGRRASLPSPAGSDAPAAAELVRAVKRAQARTYAAGLEDGVKITLELLLGRESHGGIPYDGELPADARAWANEALARINGGDAADATASTIDSRWPAPPRP